MNKTKTIRAALRRVRRYRGVGMDLREVKNIEVDISPYDTNKVMVRIFDWAGCVEDYTVWTSNPDTKNSVAVSDFLTWPIAR